MGYSIEIHCPSVDIKDLMLDFLQRNMREPSDLFQGLYNYSSLYDGPDLSYGTRREDSLGFDYGAVGDEERYYVTRVLRWAATKVGSTLHIIDTKKCEKYLVYDGLEVWPLSEITYGYQSMLISTYKRKKKLGKAFGYLVQEVAKERAHCMDITRTVRKEFKRLNKLWLPNSVKFMKGIKNDS